MASLASESSDVVDAWKSREDSYCDLARIFSYSTAFGSFPFAVIALSSEA